MTMPLGLPFWIVYVLAPAVVWIVVNAYYGGRNAGPAPGLSYVTGPMGAGKSYFLVREIEDALVRGRYVVTNVKLRDDAFRRMARHQWIGSVLAGGIRRRAAWLEARYVYVTELEHGLAHYLPCRCPDVPKGQTCVELHPERDVHVPPREGDGLFAWDEGQDQLWNVNATSRDPEALAWRKRILRVMTRMRKRGYAVLLASQHRGNTDAQLRRIATWEIRLRNQRELVRVVGLRILPMPLFIAGYYHAGSIPETGVPKGPPEYGKRYLLNWKRKLYSTVDMVTMSAELDPDAPAPIHLPRGGRRPGERAAPPAEAAGE